MDATNFENSLWTTAGDYLLHVRLRGCSPHTFRSYADTLRLLSQAVPPDLGSITRRDIQRWLDSQWARQLKPASIATHLTIIRTFFRWCVNEGLAEVNPADGLSRPRITLGEIRPFSTNQLQALFAAADCVRDRALVSLMVSTGLRRSEVAAVKAGDIEPGKLRVLGKGRKERTVALLPRTELLLRTCAEGRDGHQLLFGFSGRQVADLIHKLGKRAGVPESRCHRLSHTFATEYLRNGGHVNDLRVILGHSRLATTERYIAYGEAERAIEAQRRCAPCI